MNLMKKPSTFANISAACLMTVLCAVPFNASAQDAQPSSGVSDPATAQLQERIYVKATFEDWAERCLEQPDGGEICQMHQIVVNDEGEALAEVSLVNDVPQSDAISSMTIIAPLGTLLIANLPFSIDGGEPIIYPFLFCTELGCFSRIPLSAEEVEQLKKGSTAVATLIPALDPEQRFDVNISLKGFTSAYDAMVKDNGDILK